MRETTDVRLLPCPFCGGEAKYRPDHTTERADTVSCAPCGFYIGDDGQQGSCVALWNRRAALEPAPKPADGEWVLVPRADVEFVVRAANRNERTEGGSRLAVLLSAAHIPPSTDGAVGVGELVEALEMIARSRREDEYDFCANLARSALAAYKGSTTDGKS